MNILRIAIFTILGALGTASHAQSPVQFQMPSGNVFCYADQDGIRCDIIQTTNPRPAPPNDCEFDYGNAFWLPVSGKAELICVSDSVVAAKAPVLKYEQTWQANGLACTSNKQGLTCKNKEGHGVHLRRSQQQLIVAQSTQQPAANATAPTGSTQRVSTASNEVGNKLIVTEPIARPIYTSKSGTRYWHCDGLVNPKLIGIIYADLSALAQEEGITPPSDSICHYKISTMNLMGNTITMYGVDFYTNKASMETCVLRDYCNDFRSVNFKIKDKKLHRQYMLTNANRKLTRMQCVDMAGNIVNARGGC